MGRPELSEGELAGYAGRLRRHDELDAAIGEWTVRRNKHELMGLLQAEGIAAGAVQQISEASRDPQHEHDRLLASTYSTTPETRGSATCTRGLPFNNRAVRHANGSSAAPRRTWASTTGARWSSCSAYRRRSFLGRLSAHEKAARPDEFEALERDRIIGRDAGGGRGERAFLRSLLSLPPRRGKVRMGGMKAYRLPRRRGSSTSRTASPSTLMPNTVTVSATPGKMLVQGPAAM